jgi:hypothetical protein
MVCNRLEIIAHEDIDSMKAPHVMPYVKAAAEQARAWYDNKAWLLSFSTAQKYSPRSFQGRNIRGDQVSAARRRKLSPAASAIRVADLPNRRPARRTTRLWSRITRAAFACPGCNP